MDTGKHVTLPIESASGDRCDTQKNEGVNWVKLLNLAILLVIDAATQIIVVNEFTYTW